MMEQPHAPTIQLLKQLNRCLNQGWNNQHQQLEKLWLSIGQMSATLIPTLAKGGSWVWVKEAGRAHNNTHSAPSETGRDHKDHRKEEDHNITSSSSKSWKEIGSNLSSRLRCRWHQQRQGQKTRTQTIRVTPSQLRSQISIDIARVNPNPLFHLIRTIDLMSVH